MPNFFARLKRQIFASGNALCVGVDPQTADDPFLERAMSDDGPARFLSCFTQAMVDAATRRVAVVKFQCAYYEAYGALGEAALRDGISMAKSRGLLTILDAKRGDIASTMAAYGRMAFEAMGADALTVTPYMGYDVIEPLLPWLANGCGVYAVWISSNQSGVDLQECALADGRIFAEAVLEAIGPAPGLVLGATKVDRLRDRVYDAVRHRGLLMPGLGAQGATVTPRLRELIKRGLAIVPQSRSLSAGSDAAVTTWKGYSLACAARTERAAAELS